MAQQPASVTLGGTPENPVLNFVLPTGPKGEPGGWNAGTNLGTTDLNTVITPGLYYQSSANTIAVNGPALNYPSTVTSGGARARFTMSVQNWGGNGAVKQVIQTVGTATSPGVTCSRYLEPNQNPSAWTVQVAQRVDQTAGRVIYTWDDVNNREQMIYGDTGWRTVSASTALQPIWNTTTLRLRRVGNVVDFVFLGTGPIDPAVIGLDIQGFRAIHADDVPSAFRPSANAYNMGFGRFSQSSGSASPRQYVMCVMNASGGMHFEKDETAPNGVLLGASSSIYVSGCYTTNSAWPTSLPGTASA